MFHIRCIYRQRVSTSAARSFHVLAQLRSAHRAEKRTTISDIQALHVKGSKISVVTAHDYISGKHANDASADMILVGDSLAMVALGYSDTNELEFDEFIYHCRAVARGAPDSFIIADMPFGSYESSSSKAIESAIKIISKGRANAVKLEGGEEITPTIRELTRVGIPVMAHVGLTPQRLNALGGFKVQGTSIDKARKVFEDALAVQDAGAFSVVLEAVPEALATYVTKKLDIPTIGIGAGPGTDGQVLVQADLLGMLDGHTPKFVKKYANGYDTNVTAIRQYVDEVKNLKFPERGTHTYKIKQEVYDAFVKNLEEVHY